MDAITSSRPVTPSPIVLTPSSVSLTPSFVLLVPTSLYPPSTSTTITSTAMVSLHYCVPIYDRHLHVGVSKRPDSWSGCSHIFGTTCKYIYILFVYVIWKAQTGISSVTISRLPIEDARPYSTLPPTTILSPPIATCITGRSPVVQYLIGGTNIRM